MTLLNPWWRIGWRNLGRNRRRTILTASALALGYFAVVLMIGIADGMISQMIENGTGLITGQLQVHSEQYRPERAIHSTIGGAGGTDVASLVADVAGDPDVVAAAPRVYGGGLVSSGDATRATVLMGIDPLLEPQVARLSRAIVRGQLPLEGTNEVAIGVEMAAKLARDLGDEVVLVAPASDGSLGNDLFTVSGVFETGVAELDRSYAMVPLDVLQYVLALSPDRVHEVAAAVDRPWLAPAAGRRVADRLDRARVAVGVEPWTEYRPDIAEYAQMADAMYWIVILIVFAMAMFGVADTMLMSTFERRREFALLMAIGTMPRGIVLSLLCEALALGILSLAAGAAITTPVMMWFHNTPPDLSGLVGDFSISGALVRPVLKVEYSLYAPLWTGLALLLTTVFAVLYPAYRAARTPPADTLQDR